MMRSTDQPRRIIAPAEGQGGRYDVISCARVASVPRWKTTFGGSLWREKGVTIGGARSEEKSTTGSNQTLVLV